MNHRIFLAMLMAVACLTSPGAQAQDRAARFGAGTHALISTVDGLGLGVTGRVSIPLNADISVAIGSGLTGFILGGTEDAEWLFTPQVSAIVTLPGLYKAPYFIVGAGGYLPIGDPGRDRAGPTIHFGVGWVRQLSQSSLFYEIDPTIILEDSRIDLAIPVRIGIIF